MKVAISSQGPGLASALDMRFGRAAWFVIVDTESGESKAVENAQNLEAAQGAGIQSAQCVANEGAEAVITGHCGPKAYRVLKSAGVRVYLGVEGTVEDALDKFKSGGCEEAAGADVEGHWV